MIEYQDYESEVEIEQDRVFFMNQMTNESKINNNIWMVNSGVSSHMTNCLEGIMDLKNEISKINIRSRKTMIFIKRGTYKGMVVSKDNKKTMIQLKNVRYVPEMFCKIISLT